MSNQEAISLLRNLEDALDSYCELNEEGKLAFRMAITALELFGISEQLPPAQPERKIGKWMRTARWDRVYFCDQCGNYLDFDGVNAGRGSANFCPNCGADMRGKTDR